MSEQARTYFQDRIEHLGIADPPEIMDGTPQLLYPQNIPHSLTRDDAEAHGVHEKYRGLIAEVGNFLLRATAAEQGLDDKDYAVASLPKQMQRMPDFMAGYKKPLVTGQLRDLSLEVIATPEIHSQYTSEFAKFGWLEGTPLPADEVSHAFLMLSGEHWIGGRLRGVTGRFINVRAKGDLSGFNARVLNFRQTGNKLIESIREERKTAACEQYL